MKMLLYAYVRSLKEIRAQVDPDLTSLCYDLEMVSNLLFFFSLMDHYFLTFQVIFLEALEVTEV